MLSSFAPGKIILFGEHAVVYGQPALAVPVTQLSARVDIEDSPDEQTWIDAPDIGVTATLEDLRRDTHPLAFVIGVIYNSLGARRFLPIRIRITSTIPIASGLGSGTAVSIALIRALATTIGLPVSNEQVNTIAFEAERVYHGAPSGIDNTVITYSQPIYFIKGQPPETFQAREAFTIAIADTGIPAPTRDAVADVRRMWQQKPEQWEAVFTRVGGIARAAREKIESGQVEALGPLMDENHALLQEMTVSSAELDRLVEAARSAGALGAKLSGGGRGGNMIALVPSGAGEQVQAALEAAGAAGILLTTVQ
ncbi:MAG: mevalonate kinase [Anaerolineales bacterium]|nr:mevalonate kinase [Anaerolineales bacterium]